MIIFRRRSGTRAAGGIRIPGHPYSTIFFIIVSLTVVVNAYIAFPADTLIGLGVLLLGAPIYMIWKRPAGSEPGLYGS